MSLALGGSHHPPPSWHGGHPRPPGWGNVPAAGARGRWGRVTRGAGDKPLSEGWGSEGWGGGAELQREPQIARFLIKEKRNERKTHKVRKLPAAVQRQQSATPLMNGRGTGWGHGDLDGDSSTSAWSCFTSSPSSCSARGEVGVQCYDPLPPPAPPWGLSPTSVTPRIIRRSRKMLTKSRKRSMQCLRGQRDTLRGARVVPCVSPPPALSPTRCNPCPRSPPSR